LFFYCLFYRIIMSKINNELKNVIQSNIDELYDRINSGSISTSDAVEALRVTFRDIGGAVFCLKKDHLKRAFIVCGLLSRFPARCTNETLQSSRLLLDNFLFPRAEHVSDDESDA